MKSPIETGGKEKGCSHSMKSARPTYEDYTCWYRKQHHEILYTSMMRVAYFEPIVDQTSSELRKKAQKRYNFRSSTNGKLHLIEHVPVNYITEYCLHVDKEEDANLI